MINQLPNASVINQVISKMVARNFQTLRVIFLNLETHFE